MKVCRHRRGAYVLPLLLCLSPAAYAAEDAAFMIAQLRAEFDTRLMEVRQEYEARIAALERRLGSSAPSAIDEDLEREAAAAIQADAAASAADPSAISPLASPGAQRVATVRLIDLSLNGLFVAGGSTAREATLRELHGGGHDPKNRGFTLQQTELAIQGAVDPYFDAAAYFIFQIDEEGESFIEVEEAWMRTQNLPLGLQLKGGQFFTEFGRLNPQHPHSWSFVDQPVVNTRLLGGDGTRQTGAQVSWLAPLSWYSEFTGALQNARGETAASFLSSEEEEGTGGHPFLERDVRDASDLLASGRWLNSWSISEELTLNLGASGMWGPNATGDATDTQIYGADLYAKWQPTANERGWPFLSLQAESIWRRYEAGSFFTEDEELGQVFVAADTLWDWGAYVQGAWGFHPGFVANARFDFADGRHGQERMLDPLRSERNRLSYNLTWYPTEFSKLRVQHNVDWADYLEQLERHGEGREQHSLWFQWEFTLGAHGAHKF